MHANIGYIIVALVTLPVYTCGDGIDAIKGLVYRLVGEDYVMQFHYELIPQEEGKDVFEIDTLTREGKVLPVLRGNNGVALATALNYYLKYQCYCSVSWGDNGSGDQLRLLQPLPTEFSRVRHVMRKYRYYLNVATFSYSMAWWDIDRWTREIDWMALNSINMPLSFTGQEYVWKKFYLSLGLSESDINEYFSGPAFLAWQRLGYLKGWGGPLDDNWITAQRDLQLQILTKTREFGMTNVLPGFSGYLPDAVKSLYPNATFIKNPNWEKFNSTYSGNYLLEPTDPLFLHLGARFYKLLTAEYGSDHMFNVDTYSKFHPSSHDPLYLAAANRAIYDPMVAVDVEAIYVVQSLPFQNYVDFWDLDAIKAFLSGVPDNKMIVLDVNSVGNPAWLKTDSFYGKPFIYCLEHNFGGMRGIYGNMETIAIDPMDAAHYKNSSLVGIGLTPEAIEQNPVIYDMMSEFAWRKEKIDVDQWISLYAVRRYGNINGIIGENLKTAWNKIQGCCYGYYFSWNFKSLVERAPIILMDNGYWIGYQDTTMMVEALGLLLSGYNSSELRDVGPYQYDVVDITRQAITNLFTDVHVMFGLAYKKYQYFGQNSSLEFIQITNAMLEMITDLDKLLASDENFLLGKWIKGARSSVKEASKTVQDLYEFNARNQITMWGYQQNIEDYASKQWAGLVGDYYQRRWKLLITFMLDSILKDTELDFDAYEKKRFLLESSWDQEHNDYPTKATGNSLQVAYELYNKYVSVQNSSVIYKSFPNSTMEVDGLGLFGYNFVSWTTDVNQLRFLCNINPTCVGFNSVGMGYNSTGPITQSWPITLYLKQT